MSETKPIVPIAVAGIGIVCVFYAAVQGLLARGFDYDEIEHAHVIWLIAQGQVPFTDFFECHPPFLWYILLPFSNIADPHDMVMNMRVLALLGNFALMVATAAHFRQQDNKLAWHWLGLSFALMASDRNSLDFLLEARPDAWANAAVIASILGHRYWQSGRLFLRYMGFAGAVTMALLCSPKLALLVILYSAFDLHTYWRDWLRLGQALLGHISGIATALGIAAAILVRLNVSPVAAFRLSIEYHSRFAKDSEFVQSLATRLADTPLLLAAAVLGGVLWGGLLYRRQRAACVFELALMAFLLAQAILISFPHKQYTVPWLLFSAVFVAVAIQHLASRIRHLPIPLATAIGITVAITATRAAQSYQANPDAERMRQLTQFVRQVKQPGGYVITPLPFHPITEYDSFYGWVRSVTNSEYETETLMREWRYEPFSSRFSATAYREQLLSRPPSVILVINGDLMWTADQEAAIREYLSSHRDTYRLISGGSWQVWIHQAAINHEYVNQLHAQ